MKENNVDHFMKDPKKALIKLSIPIMVAMLVQTTYNIVDTAYVGRLGSQAIAALTFSYPIFFLLISINSGISVGVNSKISRLLGSRKKKEAENTAIHGILISIIAAAIISAAGITFLEGLFILFGVSNTVMPLAVSYMLIILLGTVFMFPGFLIAGIFTAQGDSKTPMKVQIAGLILNIILDPIFIYTFNYGVAGAAIATVISFAFSLILSLYYLHKKSYLHLHIKNFRYSNKIINDIFKVGAPAGLMMIFMSFYMMFLNWFIAIFGTEYVAGFGIASKLESLMVLPIISISMALVTVCGMCYGAKRYDLLKDVSYYGIRTTVVLTSAIGIILFAFPGIVLMIFTNDTNLINIGSRYLQIAVFSYPLIAITFNSIRILQGIGKGMPGLVINAVRVFIVGIPLTYILVFLLKTGYLSVPIAMLAGSAASAVISLIWLRKSFHKLKIN